VVDTRLVSKFNLFVWSGQGLDGPGTEASEDIHHRRMAVRVREFIKLKSKCRRRTRQKPHERSQKRGSRPRLLGHQMARSPRNTSEGRYRRCSCSNGQVTAIDLNGSLLSRATALRDDKAYTPVLRKLPLGLQSIATTDIRVISGATHCAATNGGIEKLSRAKYRLREAIRSGSKPAQKLLDTREATPQA